MLATDLDTVGDVRLDVDTESVNTVDGLLQFVRTLLLLRMLQTLGTE